MNPYFHIITFSSELLLRMEQQMQLELRMILHGTIAAFADPAVAPCIWYLDTCCLSDLLRMCF